MTLKVLGGGHTDGHLGTNPDWVNIEADLDKQLWSIDDSGRLAGWLVEEDLKESGNELANGLFANPRDVVSESQSEIDENAEVIKSLLIAQGLSGNYGFFAKGFTYNEVGDVGIDADGAMWTYSGGDSLPVEVSAGTVPSDGDYEQVSLQDHNSTTNRGAKNAHQQYRELGTVEEVKNGYFDIGTKLVLIDRGGAKFDVIDTASYISNGFNVISAGSGKVAILIIESGEIKASHWGVNSEESTEAFNAINAYIAATTTPVLVDIDTDCIVNPLLTTRPLGVSKASLITLTSDKSTITGNGIISIDDTVDYTAPFSIGDEKYWAVCEFEADDCSMVRLAFDGKGTHTASGYNPSVVNIRWQVAASFGSIGNHRKNNKVSNCVGKYIGGQAVSFQYQDHARIIFNSFDNHSGMGVSVGTDPQVMYNSSKDCYDAPYPLNGAIYDGKIAFNYGDNNSNGSGIDVVGCVNTQVLSNTIKNMRGAAVSVGYSVQQAMPSSGIKIYKNTFQSNARYTGTPIIGEVVVGSTISRADNASSVEIINNDFILDGTIGDNSDRALIVDYGSSNIKFNRNKIKGVPNSSNKLISVLHDVRNLEIKSNTSEISGDLLIDISAGTTNTISASCNKGIISDTTGTLFPTIGILQDDGSIVYSIKKTIGTTETDILNLRFTSGSFEYSVVEVRAVQSGEFRGVTLNRITSKGYSAVLPTVLSNTIIEALGSNPPVVTATVEEGRLRVKIASTGSPSMTSLSIRVYGDKADPVF